MTDDKIKAVFEQYGQYVSGKDYALIRAVEAVVAPQRTWVGLTDLERAEITKLKWWDWEDSFDVDGFTRAVEAKLKEKNT